VSLATCQERAPAPLDIRVKTLDPLSATKEADSIALARVLSHRNIRKVTIHREGALDPARFEETETTLRVLRILKGPPLQSEIQYLFYDAQGYAQFGPPRGPSGPVGSSGIFFLRRQQDGNFRSIVDVHRPDIATPWLVGPIEPRSCASPTECVVEVLLSYRPSDDAEVFSERLLEDVAISERAAGFFTTFELLNRLVTNDQHPYVVRERACLELAKWYALEFPQACESLIAGTPNAVESGRVAANLRDSLRKGGVAWARRHIGSDDERELRRYLGLLVESANNETRELAEELRRKLK
jgi:hypothetical protein